MSLAQLPQADRTVDRLPAPVDVEIVIPVYNEADQLEASITALHSFLHSSFPLVSTITIADNASTDDTWRIATELADTLDGVPALHPPLVAPLLSGHSALAIGTRLAPGSHVVRSARREVISRGYNLLLRSTLRTSCSDAQCGFKAL